MSRDCSKRHMWDGSKSKVEGQKGSAAVVMPCRTCGIEGRLSMQEALDWSIQELDELLAELTETLKV